MRRWMGELKKHLGIYTQFVKNDLMSQLEYRINFYFGTFIETIFVFIRLLYVIVIYSAGVAVEGITADTMLLYVGVYSVMTGMAIFLFWSNMCAIPEHIRTGSLDLLLTKPVSLQFIVTLRHVDFGSALPNVAGGIVLIAIACCRLQIAASAANIAGLIGFMAGGLAIIYSLVLMAFTIAFRAVKVNAIQDISDAAIWYLNVMPVGIFPRWIREIGTFLVPVFVIFNFPQLFMLRQLGALHAVWGIALPVVLFTASRAVWNKAVCGYESANG